MNKFFKLFSILFLIVLSFVLVSCNNDQDEELAYYDVTFITTDYDRDDIVVSYVEGSKVKDPSLPNPNFAFAYYSLFSDFRTYVHEANFLFDSKGITSDTTIYIRHFGAKVGYINLFHDNENKGKALAMYRNTIWKLPDSLTGGIGSYWQENQQDDGSIVETINTTEMFPGYNFDGWYLDEELTEPVVLPIQINQVKDYNFYAKLGEPKVYDVSIKYVYPSRNRNSYTVERTNVSLPYHTDLFDYLDVLPESLIEYRMLGEDNYYNPITVNGKNIDEKNNGWPSAANLEITVMVEPLYEDYFVVGSSTNKNIDGKMLPYSVLDKMFRHLEIDSETIHTTKPYGSDLSVAYKLSDIESIKFKNGSFLPGDNDLHMYLQTFHGLLPNLKTIDLSEMIYIKEIPQGFFFGAENIENVIAPSLPHLEVIGGGFMSYNNIKNFDFDFSNVEIIGDGFLNYAFSSDIESVNIDLSKLTSIKNSGYYSLHGFLTNEADVSITVKIGSYPYITPGSFNTRANNKNQSHGETWARTNEAKITIVHNDPVSIEHKFEDYDIFTIEGYSGT